MAWHPSPVTQPDRTGGIFSGLKIGDQLSAGFKLELPTLVGKGYMTRAAFSVAHVDASLLSITAHPGGQVTATIHFNVGVNLKVELYVEQGVVYAGEKIAEGVVGAVTTPETGGISAAVVVLAMKAQLAYEVASAAVEAVDMARDAQKDWNLLVNTGIPLATIFVQAMKAEAPTLVKDVAAYVARALKATVTWITNGVEHTVSALYTGGKWVVKEGGRVIQGAGRQVSNGWHFVKAVFSAAAPRPASPDVFDARPIADLRLRKFRSAARLGFGPTPMTAKRARAAARALVKYGLSNVTVRPLLVDQVHPRAGNWLSIAGGRLSGGRTAVVELSGPGYRAEHLVRVHKHLAGASLRMPKTMRRGTWTVGIVDYGAARSRSGVLVDGHSFSFKPKR